MVGDPDLPGLDLGLCQDQGQGLDLQGQCVLEETLNGLNREVQLIIEAQDVHEARVVHVAQVDPVVQAAPEALEAREA